MSRGFLGLRWKAFSIVTRGDTADALALKNCRQLQAECGQLLDLGMLVHNGDSLRLKFLKDALNAH
jgi:hypothetical protein